MICPGLPCPKELAAQDKVSTVVNDLNPGFHWLKGLSPIRPGTFLKDAVQSLIFANFTPPQHVENSKAMQKNPSSLDIDIKIYQVGN